MKRPRSACRRSPRSATAARCSGEGGFVGGFEGLLFGFLLFIVGTLLAAYAWAIVDTKEATAEAARQAARTYVEAPNPSVAYQQAQLAADQALSGYGYNPARAHVALVSGTFARCGRITIAVSYPAPVLLLPIVGKVGTGRSVTARQSELVDAYRSGLPGSALCP